MSDTSARFALPYILPGQAQKELFHNEALASVDALLHPAVESGPVAAPPAEPAVGQCWLVASGGEGAWAGRDGNLAAWTEGGWRFAAPVQGMSAWNKAAGLPLQWTGAAWREGEIHGSGIYVSGQQVVGERQPSVPSPSGGTIIDAEARSAIDSVIVALRSHGLID